MNPEKCYLYHCVACCAFDMSINFPLLQPLRVGLGSVLGYNYAQDSHPVSVSIKYQILSQQSTLLWEFTYNNW